MLINLRDKPDYNFSLRFTPTSILLYIKLGKEPIVLIGSNLLKYLTAAKCTKETI